MTTPPIPSPGSGLRRKLLWGGGAIAGILIAVGNLRVEDLLKPALDWIGQLGGRGALIFILIYGVATVLFVPGLLLTLGAGALFGLVWGSIYVSIGSTLGATGAFLVSRHFAREAISRQFEGNPQFMAIDQAVAREGWKIVGLTRLSPVFAFNLLNYAFGLTRVSFRDYVLASWIGMMPGTVMYVYLGSLAQAASDQRARTSGEWAFYGVGLLATVVASLFITQTAKKALAKKTKP